MLQIHLQAKKRCYNHPHRLSEIACERCKLALCDECIVNFEGQRLCASCQNELVTAIALQPTFRERVLQRLRALRTGLIMLGVFSVLVGLVFLFWKPYFEQPLSPEEWARFRYGLAGTFETEHGINVLSTVLEAHVVSATSEAEGYLAKHLINEFTMPGYPGWRSADATLPQEIVVATRDLTNAELVVLFNDTSEPVETYVKDFEVLVSTEGPDSGFTSVGRWTLEPHAEEQLFRFDRVELRFIKLRILSRQGDAPYTSLNEFNAYLVPERRILGIGNQTPVSKP